MATKRLLVDAIHPEETRIVVTSGNRLEEFDFESATRRQLRGNIYLAKVTRVEPSLQAAFIEYGGNRHGFLAFSEIHPDYYQIPVADREALLRDEEEAEAHEEAAADAGAGESVTADAAPADEGNSSDDSESDDSGEGGVEQAPTSSEPVESIGTGDALEEMPERRRTTSMRRNYKIQEVIKRRQVMLVQVVKEERGNKGAALTTYLSLAGRYSVLMPNTARGGGISRKITNAADRKRLKDIVGDLDIPPGQGIILRTAGASRTKAEVKRDFEYLQRLWENVRSLTLRSQAPCLVYEEGSLIKRTIRDLYNKDIDEVWVAGEDAYREAKDFMRMIMPSHAKNVQLYKDEQPIFSKHNIEGQLDSMFSPQVTLPSGGYIVINPTEALVSIDVNSGRSTREHNIEDTALQTNLEASEEIARQLRLRDLAGLIVIDFIDMVENRSNRAVERKLKDCLKNDRARIQVGRISHFGLMEMSRQRIRFGVVESSTHKCPTCNGTGIVRSVESIALLVMRAVEDHVLRKPGQSINVKVPTDVALYILNTKRSTLNMLEARYDLSITIVADDHVGQAHYQIERGEARALGHASDAAASHVRVDTAAMAEPETTVEAEDDDDESSEAAAESEDAPAGTGENGDRQGRRRRRRRGRGGDREFEAREPRAGAVAAQADAGGELADTADAADEPQRAEGAGDDDEPRKRRRRGRRGGRRNRRENGDMVEAGQAETADAGIGADVPPVPADTVQQLTAAVLTQDAIAAAGNIPDAEVIEPPAKPKRTRRTRKTAEETAASVPEPIAEAVDATPAPSEPEARPKPRRGRRAAAPLPTEADALDSAEKLNAVTTGADGAGGSVPVEAIPAAPEPAPAPAARRRRKELPPDEIVISSAAAPAGEDAPKPKKAGWWQRGIFGG